MQVDRINLALPAARKVLHQRLHSRNRYRNRYIQTPAAQPTHLRPNALCHPLPLILLALRLYIYIYIAGEAPPRISWRYCGRTPRLELVGDIAGEPHA